MFHCSSFSLLLLFFFFNDTATTEIYTLSLHDALPIPGLPDAREHNFGLERAEILPGNVGYLEVTGFNEAPGFEDAMAAALHFLERTDAMIIDVRRNGGGSGVMSHLLFSHFLPADSIPTIRVKSRATPEPELRRSFV